MDVAIDTVRLPSKTVCNEPNRIAGSELAIACFRLVTFAFNGTGLNGRTGCERRRTPGCANHRV
ncbi:MAG TPA: hypothetical protein VMD51_12910, partial [Mycobacterium sp.]|nr:hypothetical protein [Mycobacterium sp.]